MKIDIKFEKGYALYNDGADEVLISGNEFIPLALALLENAGVNIYITDETWAVSLDDSGEELMAIEPKSIVVIIPAERRGEE